MGSEEYSVILSSESLPRDVLLAHLGRTPLVQIVSGNLPKRSERWSFFEYSDGKHILEIDVFEAAHLAVSFALCHPSTVDAVFVRFVRALANTLDMKVSLIKELPFRSKRDHLAPLSGHFETILLESISCERHRWHLGFGVEELPLRRSEAQRRFAVR
jgi:hypothetical protein